MDQKTRDKIALIGTIVLLPVMVYLLVSNISKAKQKLKPPAPAMSVAASPSVNGNLVQALQTLGEPKIEDSHVDPKVMEEQKKVAALLPKKNPFRTIKPAKVEIKAEPVVQEKPPSIPVLSGIISSKGASDRMAVINGKFLNEGQQIDGWTIIKITADDILVDNGKEKLTIKLGQK